MHLLIWKQTVAALVRVDTEQHPFNTHEVWAAAWTRLKKKIKAKQERAKQKLRRHESRGEETILDRDKESAPMAPIAGLSPDGDLEWNKELATEIDKLCKPKAPKRQHAAENVHMPKRRC